MTEHPRAKLGVVIPVHNGATTLARTLDRLLACADEAPSGVQIAVCDDASNDETPALLASYPACRVTTVTHANNRGRALACNDAAAALDTEFLVFLDADCEPLDTGYLTCALEHAHAGHDIVYGPITGHAEGAWARYLDAVEARRNAAALAGRHLAGMTSANLMISRELFERVGGFCPDYRHSGFEDKDLIARLLEHVPRVEFEPRMAVAHEAGNTVDSYCRKMFEAGRYTAPLFDRRLPRAYRSLSFARIDPDLRSAPIATALRIIGRFGAAPMRALAAFGEKRAWLPTNLRVSCLRLAAATAFLAGAAQRKRD